VCVYVHMCAFLCRFVATTILLSSHPAALPDRAQVEPEIAAAEIRRRLSLANEVRVLALFVLLALVPWRSDRASLSVGLLGSFSFVLSLGECIPASSLCCQASPFDANQCVGPSRSVRARMQGALGGKGVSCFMKMRDRLGSREIDR
jgi:hypothetical protein